jgi:hypothetical protein
MAAKNKTQITGVAPLTFLAAIAEEQKQSDYTPYP